MKHRLPAVILMLFAFSAWAEDSYEGEDFLTDEEGIMFEVERDGLFFRRNLYVEGDDVTRIVPGPTDYNDTRDIKGWKPYISHWNYEPPGFIVVYINDDSPHLTTTDTLVDLTITVASQDRARNLIPASTIKREGVPLKQGINRIPINIHVNVGDYLSVRMTNIVQKIPIQAIDIAD